VTETEVAAIRITIGHMFRRGGPVVLKGDVLIVGRPPVNLTAAEAQSKVAMGYAVREVIHVDPDPVRTRDPQVDIRDPVVEMEHQQATRPRNRLRAGGGKE
jgi:hypothetical protein